MAVPFCIFIVLFFCELHASARSRAVPFSLALSGSFLSKMTFGKLIPLSNTADVPEVTVLLETKIPSLGLSLGYLITERLELRGTLAYGRSEIIEDTGIGLAGIPLGKNKVAGADCYRFGAGFLYYLVPGRLSPFLEAGAGALHIKTSGLGSSTKILLEYGGGIRFDFSGHLFILLDVKDQVSFFNYPQDFEVFFVAIYDTDFSDVQHCLGVCFSLGYSL